jgi:hypothetical protein
MMMDTDRLHRLAQTSEIALNAQGRRILKLMETKRPAESREGPGGPVYTTARTVVNASAEEKRLEGDLETGFGVSICFFGQFWRGIIAGSLDFIGLERETGLEPATLCLGSRCSTN